MLILMQSIAHEVDLKTTSNYAKTHNKSFNGVKNFVSYITIDGVKFHSKNIVEDNLPF